MNLRLVIGLASLAGCGGAWGPHGSIGPVLGYVPGHGVSAGWELSGGAIRGANHLNLLPHFSVGSSWRPPAAAGQAREQLLYVAREPSLASPSFAVPAGGTLGLGFGIPGGPSPLVGTWLGAAIPLPLEDASKKCSPCFTVSLALGWRWSRAHEFYLTPKVGFIDRITLFPDD
jgi:hypothetical protein